MTTNFDYVFAVPGENSIIDAVHPETGRTQINDHTLEQVRERHPNAVQMTWEEWRAEQAAKQQTPLHFTPTTERKYHEMLEVLPPAAWESGAFLVGEPTDHCFETGRPRFQMYRTRGTEHYRRYEASSRPVTIVEFRANR